MSTLTKTLIVLLTVSSIFLCGIIVTFVANADNYKQKYEGLRSNRDSLNRKVDGFTKQLNEQKDQQKRTEDRLNARISSLRGEANKVRNALKTAEREKAALLQKVNSWTSITRDFYETTDKQGQHLKDTLGEVKRIKAEQIKERKELKETTAFLMEKMAIIDTLESEKRRLREDKTELQARLDRYLQITGQITAGTRPVTPRRTIFEPIAPLVEDIGLQGLITKVDLKNSVAGISLGSADGVRTGMKFHVTRGDKFICDILVINVDMEEAVGVLELVQQQPRAGDNASTNL